MSNVNRIKPHQLYHLSRKTGWILLVLLLCGTTSLFAQEPENEITDSLWKITYRDQEGQTVETSGRLLIRAQDGGILLEQRNGFLLNVIPDAI
ncbi:MAG: hypothetical protein KDA65_17630, partial [Planctomycetaceae bacterium]|nr:hypothetical protein [Planctomycetaceae bacterium]